MADRETIDSKFVNDNYSGSATRNARVFYGNEAKRPERDERVQRERVQLRAMAYEQAVEEEEQKTRAERVALFIRGQAVAQAGEEQTGIFSVVQKNIARIRVVSVTSTVAIWATPIYLFWILPIGALATISFGLAAALFQLFSTADAATFQALIDFQNQGLEGATAEGFVFMWLAFGLVVLVANFIIILGASAEFKIAFIKPWFGHGTALKLGCIILTIIGSFLPLVQLAPTVLVWVLAVFFYPK